MPRTSGVNGRHVDPVLVFAFRTRKTRGEAECCRLVTFSCIAKTLSKGTGAGYVRKIGVVWGKAIMAIISEEKGNHLTVIAHCDAL